MKRLIAALLVSLLTLAAPALSAPPDDMQQAADAIGADVDVLYSADGSLNAGFLPAGTYCTWFYCEDVKRAEVIFMGDWSAVPYEIRLSVLYHELGHYRQWVEGRLGDFEHREWDADVYAANTMCREGRDGVDLIRQAAGLFLARSGRSWGYGHGGDHGSWYERVENVKANATACRRETETP